MQRPLQEEILSYSNCRMQRHLQEEILSYSYCRMPYEGSFGRALVAGTRVQDLNEHLTRLGERYVLILSVHLNKQYVLILSTHVNKKAKP